MQPEFSPMPRTGEQMPSQGGEVGYNLPPGSAPELSPERSPERTLERSPAEYAPQPVQAPYSQAPQALPPVPSTQASPDDTIVTSSNPISANDDDMIEKEWVDRAKQILAQTHNDPYAREKAIGELQRDYLLKRYGKQLGSTAD